MRVKPKARRIDAGKYRTLATVEEPIETVNAMHEVAITWQTHSIRWLEEQPTNGREYQTAMTTIPSLRGIYRTRSDSVSRAITPRMRIIIGDRVLGIDSAFDEGGERREVVIWCIEEADV